jgi:hypothetical protein
VQQRAYKGTTEGGGGAELTSPEKVENTAPHSFCMSACYCTMYTTMIACKLHHGGCARSVSLQAASIFWAGAKVAKTQRLLAPLSDVGTVRRWSSTLAPRHASGGTGLCSGIIPAVLVAAPPTLAHDHLL